MTITGSVTNPTRGTVLLEEAKWRRVGDTMEINYSYAQIGAGSAGSGDYYFSVPSGFAIDYSKMNATQGSALFSVGSAAAFDGSGTFTGNVQAMTSNRLWVTLSNDVSGVTAFSSSRCSLGNAVSRITFAARVPILGWSSTVQMSNDTDTRVVAARYSFSGSHTTNDAFQALPTPSVSFDTHGALNTSNGTFTVPVSGVYRAAAKIGFVANASGVRALQLLKNGSSVFLSLAQVANSGSELANGAQGVTILSLNAGDTLQWQGYQNSGGTLAYSSTASVQSITFERLSGPSAIAATETVACKYQNTAGTAIPSPASPAIIPFATKLYDTHGAWSGTTFTAPVSGIYSVSVRLATVLINLPTNNGVVLQLLVTSTPESLSSAVVLVDVRYAGGTAREEYPSGNKQFKLAAGDTISVRSYASVATTLQAAGQNSDIEIVKVGNY
jgi:hypothetical protein